jgi:hypothetical protein
LPVVSETLRHIDYMNENVDIFVPDNLNITDAAHKDRVGENIRRFYFGDKWISTETKKEFAMASTRRL